MRKLALSILGLAMLAAPAMAQQPAEQMTCGQAIDYFARYGVIYKYAHGKLLPIRQGVPIALPLPGCYGPYAKRFTYRLRTLDNPRCVISHYCVDNY